MAARECLDCTALYSIGAVRCPHCNSERGRDQRSDPEGGDTMPKITRHGGPSYAGGAPGEDTAAPEVPEEKQAPAPDDEQDQAPKEASKKRTTTRKRRTASGEDGTS